MTTAPTSTYRLQLTPSFGFDQAAAVVPYLAALGVTHVYCSPWLRSAPGSEHGYDVVDHSRVDSEIGGADGLARLRTACDAHGLGIVLDIVPNHMDVGHEALNLPWWSVLRDGPASPYAPWFDLDWSRGKLLLPVLGGPLAEVLDDLVLDSDRVRYFEHAFPLAPGTLVEGDVPRTLEQQHWQLVSWRTGSEELSHRRFFDVTTLAGVRVEDPEVFEATHRLVLQQVADGTVDGLRVDHPDGLADPGGYLTRLAEATGGAWTVAEKILEPDEELPDWDCAGTTGYDALNQVLHLFVDPAGEAPLTSLWESLTGDRSTWEQVVDVAKHQVLDEVLVAEVDRLVDVAIDACEGLDVTRRGLREALVEVLASFEVYRAYVPPRDAADDTARERVLHAVAQAQQRAPRRARECEVVGQLALGELRARDFVTRFQQTCGPVMAKGVEDTACYRYLRLTALNEVGGDPGRFGLSVEQWHRWCARQAERWPTTMTTLSTHDTKRSEDVRARLVLLSQHPRTWGEAVTTWTALAPQRLDGATEQLVWQTLVGAWPLPADRAVAYLEKATREAKTHTSWLDPDSEYDAAVAAFVRGVLDTPAIVEGIAALVDELAPSWRSTVLAQKLVQLMMPGVADTYQGCELVDLSLVDPDNRRPVDYDRRRHLLTDPDGSLDADKLRVTATALRLRRDRALVGAAYAPVDAPPDVLAFRRGDDVAVVVPLRGGHAELALDGFDDLLPDLPVRLLLRR